MANSAAINERAKVGFAKSAAYDQYRPAYSDKIVRVLLDALKVSGRRHAKILDLASGTGKFTEALAAQDEEYEIVAVEPHASMRHVLADKNLPRVTVKDGKGESIPLESESVDAVICAQAFHWFANKDALREINRVLVRHGSLGMVWNIDDYNAPRGHKTTTTWEAKVKDLLWSFEDDEPRFRHGKWRQVFDDQVKSTPLSLIPAGDEPLFSLPLGEHEEKFEVWLPKEKIWERYNTLSQISILEGDERERTYKVFMDALSGPEVVTDGDGNVALHGKTFVLWTSKIPDEGRDGLADAEEPEP